MDILSDILNRVGLRGTLYFRTSLTAPWGVEVPKYQNVARFHFAHKGRCLVRIAGVDQPVALEQGDLVIIPHGATHRLYCTPENEHVVMPLERVLQDSGFRGEGVLVYGGDVDLRDTQLVCGHFSYDPETRHPLLQHLPPVLHIRNYGESAGRWMEYTLRMIGEEAGKMQAGGDLIALKMSEIIFAQALRAYLDHEGAHDPGLAGFADRQIGRALSALHKDPGRGWRLADLAKEAGMSRTGFALRFSEVMDMTPMAYLTGWRMQIARDELRKPEKSLADVAEEVGYASETAFSRAFRKEFGKTPAAYRRAA